MKARSAHVIFGREPTWRCNTTSWWRSNRISADFHDSERRDSRNHPNISANDQVDEAQTHSPRSFQSAKRANRGR